MSKALTAISVAKAKPNPDKRTEIPDGGTGLYLVIQTGGGKSWAHRYPFRGRREKLTLGPVLILKPDEVEPQGNPQIGDQLTLRAARELVAKQQRAIRLGSNPAEEFRRQRTIRLSGLDKFDVVIGDYVSKHVRINNRPKTAYEYERLLNSKVIPAWKGLRLGDVTRRDVITLLDEIAAAGAPVSANRVLALLKTFFSWCIQRDLISVSPCAGLNNPAAEKARERVLTDHEIRVLWEAAGAIGEPFGPMVKFLLLTGQRLNEVAKMRWSEVDLSASVWSLSGDRVKNAKAQDVQLSKEAIYVLAFVTKLPGVPDYVFTSGRVRNLDQTEVGESEAPPLRPVSGFSKAKARLTKEMGLIEARAALEASSSPVQVAIWPQWGFHDLRRTAATRMQALGVPLQVIEQTLNHISGSTSGLTGTYQVHKYGPEKRKAMDAWAREVVRMIGSEIAS
jgi:integrase